MMRRDVVTRDVVRRDIIARAKASGVAAMISMGVRYESA